MGMNNNQKLKIVEYSEMYKDQVRDVVWKTLADICVIDKKDLPIDDDDLSNIKEIYSGKGNFWVALDGEDVVGTVAVRDMGNNIAKLKRMFVLVEYHGSGIGKELLDCALDFAKKQGFTKIILNTHLLMHRAHRFYEKNGFIQTDKTEEKFSYTKAL